MRPLTLSIRQELSGLWRTVREDRDRIVELFGGMLRATLSHRRYRLRIHGLDSGSSCCRNARVSPGVFDCRRRDGTIPPLIIYVEVRCLPTSRVCGIDSIRFSKTITVKLKVKGDHCGTDGRRRRPAIPHNSTHVFLISSQAI